MRLMSWLGSLFDSRSTACTIRACGQGKKLCDIVSRFLCDSFNEMHSHRSGRCLVLIELSHQFVHDHRLEIVVISLWSKDSTIVGTYFLEEHVEGLLALLLDLVDELLMTYVQDVKQSIKEGALVALYCGNWKLLDQNLQGYVHGHLVRQVLPIGDVAQLLDEDLDELKILKGLRDGCLVRPIDRFDCPDHDLDGTDGALKVRSLLLWGVLEYVEVEEFAYVVEEG